MALDANIEIRVTGKNEASPALQQATKDVDKLRLEYERLQAELKQEVSINGRYNKDGTENERATQLKKDADAARDAYQAMAAAGVTSAAAQAAAAKKLADEYLESVGRRAAADATYTGSKTVMNARLAAAELFLQENAARTGAVVAMTSAEKAAAEARYAALKEAAAARTIAANKAEAAAAVESAAAQSAAMTAAATGIGIAVAAIVVAASLAIGAFTAMAAAAHDAIMTASSWAETVDDINDVTGASTEAASALAYIAEVAGTSPDAVQTAMAMNSRIIADAERQMADNAKETAELKVKFAENETEAKAALQERRTEDERNHAERVADIQRGAGASSIAFMERMAEREEDSLRQRERTQRSYYERVSDQAEAHVDRVANLQQGLAEAEEAIAERAQARADRLAERLENFDETTVERRLSIQQRVSQARDEFEKKALEGQLADFDKTTAEERSKLEAKAAQEEEKAKAADAKQLKRLKDRIDAENLEYDRQFRRQKQQFEEQEREKADAYARDTARMEKAQAQQSAAVGARLAAEESAFARMTAAREKAAAKAEEDRQKGFEKQLENIKEKSPAVVKLIEDMGIKWDELIKMGPDEMFVRIAEGIGKVGDAQDKINLLNKLYGRGGWSSMYEIIDLIAKKGFPALMQAAKDAGVVLDKDTTEKFENAQRTARELDLKLMGLKVAVGVELLPIWEKLLKGLEKFWKEHGKEVMHIMMRLVEDIMPPLLTMFDSWLTVMGKIADSKFFNVIGGAANLLATLIKAPLDAGSQYGDWVRSVTGTGQQTPYFAPTTDYYTGLPTGDTMQTARPPGWVGPWPPGNTTPGSGGNRPGNAPTINITNNYPSPPVTSDEALGYWLLTLGLGGRK